MRRQDIKLKWLLKKLLLKLLIKREMLNSEHRRQPLQKLEIRREKCRKSLLRKIGLLNLSLDKSELLESNK